MHWLFECGVNFPELPDSLLVGSRGLVFLRPHTPSHSPSHFSHFSHAAIEPLDEYLNKFTVPRVLEQTAVVSRLLNICEYGL